jgi:hypothetical protein
MSIRTGAFICMLAIAHLSFADLSGPRIAPGSAAVRASRTAMASRAQFATFTIRPMWDSIRRVLARH